MLFDHELCRRLSEGPQPDGCDQQDPRPSGKTHRMTQDDRMRDRIRWHCRRGMLELDLTLNKFVERHLARLEPAKLAAFNALLARTDPELLDLVMGRAE